MKNSVLTKSTGCILSGQLWNWSYKRGGYQAQILQRAHQQSLHPKQQQYTSTVSNLFLEDPVTLSSDDSVSLSGLEFGCDLFPCGLFVSSLLIGCCWIMLLGNWLFVSCCGCCACSNHLLCVSNLTASSYAELPFFCFCFKTVMFRV